MLRLPSADAPPRTSTRNSPDDARLISLRQTIRHWLGPSDASPRWKEPALPSSSAYKPDLVHALRIPYEGMLAANAGLHVPLIVSVWGNDFTLHAPSTPLMRHHTHWTMLAADALHADCERDIRLAHEWGLDSSKPTLVSPGNGGIHADIFFPPCASRGGAGHLQPARLPSLRPQRHIFPRHPARAEGDSRRAFRLRQHGGTGRSA